MDSTFRSQRTIDVSDQIKIFAVASVVTTIVLFLSWLNTRKAAQHGLRLPPGPRGLPVLGSMLSVGEIPHRSFAEMAAKYGPLIYLHMGSVPILVVCDWTMAQEILKVNDQYMASRPHMTVTSYLFYNNSDVGFSPYGPKWRTLRKICTLKLFTASRLHHFRVTREREVLSMVQSVLQESESQEKAGHGVEMDSICYTLLMNTITQMMWNKTHRTYTSGSKGAVEKYGDEVAEVIREFFELLAVNCVCDYIPFLKPLYIKFDPQGVMRKLKSVHEKLDEFLEQIIAEHKSEKLANPSMDTAESNDKDDLVDVLLKSEVEENISRDSTKAVLVDLIAAGTDTTATTIEWALAELIKNPKLMKKAQEELDSVVGRDRLVTEADAANLNFFQAVIKETLRLHPPAPIPMPRESIAHCKIAGYDIPEKTRVYLNIWQVQRDPAAWKDPLVFDPERFLGSREEDGVDYKGHDYKLIPFSSGRRQCPAVNLATNVLHLALPQLVHAIEWSLPGNQRPEEMDMTPGTAHVTMKAEPLTVLAKPRLPHHVIFPSEA